MKYADKSIHGIYLLSEGSANARLIPRENMRHIVLHAPSFIGLRLLEIQEKDQMQTDAPSSPQYAWNWTKQFYV